MWCFHKYGKVENGYQYCEKCGKAIVVPCSHTYEIIDQREYSKRSNYSPGEFVVAGTRICSRCTKCGDIKHDVFKVNVLD